MRTLVFVSILSVSSLGMTQYASGEGPPDEQADANDGPSEETDREARNLYEAGTAAFQDGRFEDALARWQEAHELSERPELLYNIGTAYDRLGQGEEALASYRAFLEAVPDAGNVNYVRRRIEVLEGQAEQGRDETVPVDEAPEQEAPPASSPSRAGPIALFAVAGAAVVTAVVTGVVANDRYGSIEDRCTDGLCPPDVASDQDTLRALTRTTDIMLGVALLAGVGGLVWLLVDDGQDETVAVDCGLGGCTVSGRF